MTEEETLQSDRQRQSGREAMEQRHRGTEWQKGTRTEGRRDREAERQTGRPRDRGTDTESQSSRMTEKETLQSDRQSDSLFQHGVSSITWNWFPRKPG